MAEQRREKIMASSSFSLYLVFFLWVSLSKTASSQEEKILLQLKQEWGNPSSLSSWVTSSPLCNSWVGVSCGGGAVTAIELSQMNLVGTLPAAVCDLQNLTVLDLSDNYIGGGFPFSLYNCSSLLHLDISENLFTGELPPDIDRLAGVQLLDLSGNNFSGKIPPAISRISSLRELHLDNNLFEGSYPPEIGSLPELQFLSLAFNPFAPARIPPELGNLTKLKFLWIAGANLAGEIPPELGKLRDLEFLQLSENDLEGSIPEEIWGLTKLKFVYLYFNGFSGEISGKGTIASVNLTEVDLSRNRLRGGIPPEFGRNPNLRLLYLYSNQLSGEIPASIGEIPALQDLKLFENNLTGRIPPAIGSFSKLKNFELWKNGFYGEIPAGICAGGELESLVLHQNSFNGSLPESLGSCRMLQTLRISGNFFSGEVPAGIWTLKNLSAVFLGENKFTGELPASLPAALSRLEIDVNGFVGEIPSSAPALKVFRASNNSFSGKIFPDFSGMSLLQELLLDGNQISGEIPAGIGALKSLTVLNLRSNLLYGKIPREIGTLPVLTSLDLSENELSGEIPPEMGNLKLNLLNLSGNRLSGEIPPPLQNQAYSDSFHSNPDLCSSTSFLNLHPCSAKSRRSGDLSRALLAAFLSMGSVFFLATILLVFLILRNRYKKKAEMKTEDSWKLTSFQTLNFSESQILRGIAAGNLVGGGGSSDVYRIQISNTNAVAVKRLRRNGEVDAKLEKEFDSEVKILSSIRHANIVKLLCCISGDEEKLLVYEFMENGSLDQWIHGERSPEMSWPARLSAAVGSARGICYMHEDCSPAIIHRDIKSSNILLDSNFQARVSDFGISRILGNSSCATALAGSPGYMAPEQAYGGRINEKVDVYSFGVVLLEIATGRTAANGGDGGGNLAEWAWRRLQDGASATEGLDRRILDERYTEEMEVVYRLGIACTAATATMRPTMREVLQVLLRCEQKCGESGEGDESPTPLLGDISKRKSRRQNQLAGEDELAGDASNSLL